jgi:glycosyltransferase involved in cell wall biosynthesis
MVIVHLFASPFLGGPERQFLGLVRSHSEAYRSVLLSFAESGSSRPFVDEARRLGFEAHTLQWNHPRLRAAASEIAGHLRRVGASVLCCHGYKPDIVGWWAARQVGIPVIAVAHGWTGATFKVRLNEAVDRFVMRRMDAVVCVSEGQAVKVRRSGVRPERSVVIRNAIDPAPFQSPDPTDRVLLEAFFAKRPTKIVGAVGRLSPEKGFDQLIAAAEIVLRQEPDVGFVLFGDGPLRQALDEQLTRLKLGANVVLAGFRRDVARFFPHFDVFTLPSYTEGLPNVVLEAFAAGVPVVATAVGGTPEVIEDGVSGYLVPPRDPAALAERILELLGHDHLRKEMGARARLRVAEHFTFEAHSRQYELLFEKLVRRLPLSKDASATPR